MNIIVWNVRSGLENISLLNTYSSLILKREGDRKKVLVSVHSLKERDSIHDWILGQGMVKVDVVPHGPDDLLCPGGAAL